MPHSEIFICPPGDETPALAAIHDDDEARQRHGSMMSKRFGVDEHAILAELLGVPGPDWGSVQPVDPDGSVLISFPSQFVAALAVMEPAEACREVLTRTGFETPEPSDSGWGAFYEALQQLAARAARQDWAMWQWMTP